MILNYDYIYMLWIFGLGVVLTVAYQTEEILENEIHKTTSRAVILGLLFAKALIGGILIVLAFFALEELNIHFSIYGFNIAFGTVTNLLIASIICLWGANFYRATHGVLKRKGEEI